MGSPIGGAQLPAAPAVGATPRTSTSAADVQSPRFPASLQAVNLTYRAGTAGNVAVFTVWSSGQVPVVTGVPHVVPSALTATEYLPIVPLREPSWRGR